MALYCGRKDPDRDRLGIMDKPTEAYVARRPRHRAGDVAPLRVEVERAPGSVPGSVDVELVDLSRTGARLRSPVPLAEAEAITVRLHDQPSQPRLTRSGTVRWTRPDRGGTWSIGCQFSQPVDWETLGELFLGEILSQKGPPRSPGLPPSDVPADAPGDPSPYPPIERPLDA